MTDYSIHHADAFAHIETIAANSVHAVVTDPPYSVVEYTPRHLAKRRNGRGGNWRLPPAYDGARRRPVPRFTALSDTQRTMVAGFFARFAELVLPVLVPGAHVFIATTPVMSHLVYGPMIDAGFEKRGEIVRIVKTLRGGDRPKNAHDEYPNVCVMPRANWEPWGLFRKPLDGRVRDNLRRWGTGGLRRISDDVPFRDLIECGPARGYEREIADHPSLKPQSLMRQLVHASLPLGDGVVLDPFMGSGATIAAAAALGIESIGIEIDAEFYTQAALAIPQLAALDPPDAPRRL
ncbi:MAG: site-specific DNA-methyltransferase [Acidimicrobiaceae bacterium]|nr:site-specific DNA-methyltransferase [Acidimicrobiaceae bacterium]MYH78636.1 site-specific DNA-methyltransferase [Acidimicrobiaceae bacterium]MYK66519.1 site-specific DNA-methyltransferase [Gemmatimonadota bacterium]